MFARPSAHGKRLSIFSAPPGFCMPPTAGIRLARASMQLVLEARFCTEPARTNAHNSTVRGETEHSEDNR